ncbi:hypothetical protein HanRHA438_Chr02g0082931 [Helianthus annuus]|nr:hypothetical protein HanRHA438_Chr02g0082931 [Helianthus annuus]
MVTCMVMAMHFMVLIHLFQQFVAMVMNHDGHFFNAQQYQCAESLFLTNELKKFSILIFIQKQYSLSTTCYVATPLCFKMWRLTSRGLWNQNVRNLEWAMIRNTHHNLIRYQSDTRCNARAFPLVFYKRGNCSPTYLLTKKYIFLMWCS